MTQCRLCGQPLTETFADFGMAPLANSLLSAALDDAPELYHRLRVLVCSSCFLVQVAAIVPPAQIFSHYCYFSSISTTWLEHCERFAEQVIRKLSLNGNSRVVEIGSNDGSLLKSFQKRGIPVLGVDPAANVAADAIAAGIPTEVAFFGEPIAKQLRAAGEADLIIANNVLAHAPDIHDFIGGLKRLLRPGGTISVECPHLLRIMAGGQFDTIYHEHVFYFSLFALETALAQHRLRVFDVELLPVHGGSLRVFAGHAEEDRPTTAHAGAIREMERAFGLYEIDSYRAFASTVREAKCRLIDFFVNARRSGKHVVGYSAAAKGISLLNYCGIGRDFVDYVVDRSPHKQGSLLPGSHLPIYAPERVLETKPEYLVILAWNLRDEIVREMAGIRVWGGRFMVPVPEVELL